jgi:mRNA interferase RelE/StbE
MSYKVVVPKPVQKQLDNLPALVRKRMLQAVLDLRYTPRPVGSLKMRGSDNEHRIRIGPYRVRYEIDDSENVVVLLHCGHRKDVYR